MSVFEALKAGAWHNNAHVDIDWIDAEELGESKRSPAKSSRSFDGIVVPGGFGTRGVEGKIRARSTL